VNFPPPARQITTNHDFRGPFFALIMPQLGLTGS
jgi:hypothetical protein